MIDSKTIIVKKDGIVTAQMDGNIVTMSVENGRYYGFNGTASAIWKFLDAPIAVGELITKLTDDYTISEEQCEEAVIAYLTKLASENLIDVRQP
ncbi:MAG: lasso peptide biosynthesis PqqD family chaperone [Eubacteriales bacterium]|nr:lasso peptide biosynthesis PqqD family chaperone [Eubacteriales bacterium]